MVPAAPDAHALEAGYGVQPQAAEVGVALHLGEFLVGQLPGFFEQRQRDAEFADVVEHTRDEQRVEVILPHARQTPERHSHVGHTRGMGGGKGAA